MVKKVRPIPVKKFIASLTFLCLTGLLPALAAADLTPGRLDAGFNVGTGTDSVVLALAVENDGGVLVGGLFSQINGVNQPILARLRKDGTPTAFSPQVDNVVFAIKVQTDSKILIGGLFDQYDGSTRSFVGRLNGHSATAFLGQPPGTAELGKPFYHALQATGLPSPRFQVTAGALPPKLSLSRYTGVISGIPQQVGAFNLTVSAYNQFPPTAAQTFTLTVDNAHYFMPLILRP